MTPELQHVASIANVLAAIDGSVTRGCLDCGAIFKVHSHDLAGSHCPECAEKKDCCDSPDFGTTSHREDDDGNFCTVKVCRNCQKRIELTNC